MSKVLVIGGDTVSKELIKMLAMKYEGIVHCESLTAVKIPRPSKASVITNKNEWRGGSRGKGGKTKWPRR